METLYQLLDGYFRAHAREAISEAIDFVPAERLATYTKSGALDRAQLSLTAAATWKDLGTNPKHKTDERGITTLVRSSPRNYHVLSPEKSVAAWVRKADRNAMASRTHAVYELRLWPLVLTYSTSDAAPKLQMGGAAGQDISDAIARIIKARVRF